MNRAFEPIYKALEGEASEAAIRYAIEVLKGRGASIHAKTVRILISSPDFLIPVRPTPLPEPHPQMPIPAPVRHSGEAKPDPGIMRRMARMMRKGKAYYAENKGWIERCEADFSRF